MLRASWTVAVLMAGGMVTIGYSYMYAPGIYAPKLSSATTISADASAPPAEAQLLNDQPPSTDMNNQPAVLAAPSEATVEQWLTDSLDPDPDKRRAAIAAMATAQSEQVVPTLEKILMFGEPQVDRPLALSSLRALALVQGDVDGGIRNALRQAVYDGSDDAISSGAQAALEEVEIFFDHGVTEPSRH